LGLVGGKANIDALPPNSIAPMELIGMLDSHYVRRVAISLRLLGLPFEHRPLSVFSGYEQFQRINPVVKAPSLVCDDGSVLMDSGLILDYAQGLPGARRRLMPTAPAERLRAYRLLGLALAICEKSAQVLYERMRPAGKADEAWTARVTAQLLAASQSLEAELGHGWPAVTGDSIGDAGVTSAVAWRFTQLKIADLVGPADHPALSELAATAEQLPEFRATPPEPGSHPYRPT
jgi:glutathione S-transferase